MSSTSKNSGAVTCGDVAPLDLERAHVVGLELEPALAHRPDLADDAGAVVEDDDVHLGRGEGRPRSQGGEQEEGGDGGARAWNRTIRPGCRHLASRRTETGRPSGTRGSGTTQEAPRPFRLPRRLEPEDDPAGQLVLVRVLRVPDRVAAPVGVAPVALGVRLDVGGRPAAPRDGCRSSGSGTSSGPAPRWSRTASRRRSRRRAGGRGCRTASRRGRPGSRAAPRRRCRRSCRRSTRGSCRRSAERSG